MVFWINELFKLAIYKGIVVQVRAISIFVI